MDKLESGSRSLPLQMSACPRLGLRWTSAADLGPEWAGLRSGHSDDTAAAETEERHAGGGTYEVNY